MESITVPATLDSLATISQFITDATTRVGLDEHAAWQVQLAVDEAATNIIQHGYNQAPDQTIVDTTLWNPSWADAAGKIVSTLADLKIWAAALGKGTLLRPDTQAQRISNGTTVVPGVDYGFAIFNVQGWLGHNGDIPGYATVVVYLPERDATLVVIANSDVPEPHSAGQLAYEVTSIATPEHTYELGPQPPQLVDEPGD